MSMFEAGKYSDIMAATHDAGGASLSASGSGIGAGVGTAAERARPRLQRPLSQRLTSGASQSEKERRATSRPAPATSRPAPMTDTSQVEQDMLSRLERSNSGNRPSPANPRETVPSPSPKGMVSPKSVQAGAGSKLDRPAVMGMRESGIPGARAVSPSRSAPIITADGKKTTKKTKGDKVAVIPENFVRKMIAVERMRVIHYKFCGYALAGGFSRWVDTVGKNALQRESDGQKVVQLWQDYAFRRRASAHSRLAGKRYIVRTKAGASAWWKAQVRLWKRSKAATRKALLQLLTTRLVKGWLAFQSEQADVARRYSAMRRGLMFYGVNAMAKGLQDWRLRSRRVSQSRTNIRTAMLRYALRGLCMSLYSWRADSAERRRRRASMRKGLLKVVKRDLTQSYVRWIADSQDHAIKEVAMTRAIMWQRVRGMAVGFLQWCHCVEERRRVLHAMRSALLYNIRHTLVVLAKS